MIQHPVPVRTANELLCVAVLLAGAGPAIGQTLSGERKTWHKITLDFTGPNRGENPDTFLDYRMDVTFTNGSTRYVVPGYFAADGDAANSGASSGNVWRVHFAPDKVGMWRYSVSFRHGNNVAVADSPTAGSGGGHFDGATGTFEVTASDKTGRDFRGKGRLDYVGGRYLRFAGSGEYFLKQGADAPENFLAYNDFDNTPNNGNRRKSWQPHVRDWNAGDPTWRGGKGKGIIGAVNYLASEGMNAFSFLPMNINGDDRNVYPYTSSSNRTTIDVSKTAQWEVVFEHADRKGMFLHFKTQETENELLLDGGNLGTQRKLYYRELIARFGHHLALNWNLGEEINNASTAQKKAWAQYFHDHDPYHHHIVIHNGANHYDLMGQASAGGSHLTGFSLQTNRSDFSKVHARVRDYLQRSANAGKQWAVACDEPGDASHALRPDNDAGNSHTDGRKNAMWGTLMAGGWGNEWYFGYQHAHSDLTCNDFRSRDRWWDYCRHALKFFDELPVWTMDPDDALLRGEDSDFGGGRVLAKKGEVYAIYLPDASNDDHHGGPPELDLRGSAGTPFELKWYNPRTGQFIGDAVPLTGGDWVSVGFTPAGIHNTDDWAAVVTVVPEPTTAVLLALGGLGVRRRRRR